MYMYNVHVHVCTCTVPETGVAIFSLGHFVIMYMYSHVYLIHYTIDICFSYIQYISNVHVHARTRTLFVFLRYYTPFDACTIGICNLPTIEEPLCHNGATCVNTGVYEYRCVCLSGFKGRYCETRINYGR